MKFLRKKDYDNLCEGYKQLQEDKLVAERDCTQRTNIVGEHNTELVNHNMRLVADLANRDQRIEQLDGAYAEVCKWRGDELIAAGEMAKHNERLVADLANRDRQIELLNAELGPRREPISPEDREFFRSRVPIESYPGIARIAPETCTWVLAFDLSACPVCDGIHTGGICPSAKSVEYFETPESLPDGRTRQRVKRVLYRDEFDDSGIVWRTDVFGTAPAATSDTQEEVVPTGS